jgi:hypothetical protein
MIAGAATAVGCVLSTYERPGDPPRVHVPPPPVSPVSAEESAPAGGTGDPSATVEASHLLVMYRGSRSAPPAITRTKQEARARAEEAHGRALAGEDFGSLVAEYSDEPGAAARKGSLGTFSRREMVKPFSDAAFALPVGGISEVVETAFGFHVILRTR